MSVSSFVSMMRYELITKVSCLSCLFIDLCFENLCNSKLKGCPVLWSSSLLLDPNISPSQLHALINVAYRLHARTKPQKPRIIIDLGYYCGCMLNEQLSRLIGIAWLVPAAVHAPTTDTKAISGSSKRTTMQLQESSGLCSRVVQFNSIR